MNREELYEEISKQKNEMCMSERMMRYKKGEEVDFLPYSILTLEYPLLDIYGHTTSQIQNDIDVFSKIEEIKRKEYGIDGLRVNLWRLGAAMGSEAHFPEHGTVSIKKYFLEDLCNLENLKVLDPYNSEYIAKILNFALKVKERFPGRGVSTAVSGPFTSAGTLRPLEKLLKDTRKNKDELKKIIEISLESTLKCVETFVREIGKCVVSISDPVSCSNILSPLQFREFSLPYLTILIDEIKSITGYMPSLHICGTTRPIWEDLRELNISSFSVDNCEDMFVAKEIFGDKMTVLGNVPPVEVLRFGTIDDVINSVKECISKAGDSPNGYMVATGCATPFKTPEENLKAFVYAVRKYGSGAKIGVMPKGMSN